MSSENAQGSVSEIQNLKHEIDRLSRLQAAALKLSIFGGMNSHEAKEYDQRQSEITRRKRRLDALTKTL